MKQTDKINRSKISGQAFPKLHGHTKITLRNVNTGEIEVYEKDNLVTDAVANIYARNFFGAMDYSKVTPLRDMFGGVMCFEEELDTAAVLPENDGENRLIAHAGQTAHSSDSTLRGNPNGALSEEIQTDEYGHKRGYKFVWDFATNQGNGTISALALCHKWGGDLGLKPNEKITDEFHFLGVSNKAVSLNGTDYSDDFESRYWCVLDLDFETNRGIHVYLNGDELTINEVEICLQKQGINDSVGASKLLTSHVVTLTRSYDREYAAVCTDGDFVYVMRANANEGTTLNIDKVSLTTYTTQDASITDASLSLSDVRASSHVKATPMNRAIISGGYLYFPHSGLRSFYRFNLSSAADITLLATNLEEDIDNLKWGLCEISEGLIAGENFLINNNRVYPASMPPLSSVAGASYDAEAQRGRIIRQGDYFYVWTYGFSDYYPKYAYGAIIFPVCYLGTIQNLAQPVTKTNDKTMQIQYSILLAEEETEP